MAAGSRSANFRRPHRSQDRLDRPPLANESEAMASQPRTTLVPHNGSELAATSVDYAAMLAAATSVLGSVVDKVIHASPVPVTVIPVRL